jgi:LacI family transcriptional regulator
MMNDKIGIREVAKAAGVSVTTVSNSLNGGGNLPPETRERVRKIAEQLNYAPNRLARGLRSQRSRIIGFVSDEISTTPFAGRMILGAQETADEYESTLMVVDSSKQIDREAREVSALLEHQVDGIIYARMYHQVVTVPPVLRGVPTVLLDAVAIDASLSSVVPDEVDAARSAIDRLVTAGHSRIAFINNEDDIPASHGRLTGYRESLTAHGIAFDPALVIRRAADPTGGREGALALLNRANRPTAIFAFSDRTAMGVYQAVSLLGLRIPEDVSVISVDNLELIADGLLPGLTTMALPHYEMGAWAMHRLNELIQNPSAGETPKIATLTCPLIERGSVGPPPINERRPDQP